MYWTAIKAAHSAYKFGKNHRDRIPGLNSSRSHDNHHDGSYDNHDMHHRNPTSFPTVPATLHTGDYGMGASYPHQDSSAGMQRENLHSLEDVRPYLGPRSRLSQVWINRWTILILLVLARVLIAIGSLRTDIDHAQDQALGACHTVESLGSNMASMPHYLSDGVNQLAAHGVEKAVHALYSGLFDVVTAAEAIFVFWINMVYGMYECLITFAVTGALHGVVEFGTAASDFLNKTLGTIGHDIGTAVADFQKTLEKFENSFNDISSIFTGKDSPAATLDFSKEIDALNHVQLPSAIHDGLQKLNSSIPNFDEVKNFTDNILRAPFEEIKKLMNESLPVFTFDKTVFPVPERTQLAFCEGNDGITDFFDSLFHVADVARKIFCVVLILAAIIACFPVGYLEIRRWRAQKEYASRMQTHAVDNIDGVYIASRPYTAHGGIKLSERFNSNRTRILVRWFVAYITSIPALVLLSLALAGLISCLCQYILLRSVEKEVPALAADIGNFTDKIVGALSHASQQWANGTNTVINNTNNDINHKVFGWVNTSTHAVNDTLNAFVDKTIDFLNGTFGGTILYDPIMEVYNCLIGMKVAGIEHGLTWVSDHAYIELPMFPDDTFSTGAQASLSTDKTSADGQNNSFLADPSDKTADKITEVVAKLADKLASGIRTEALLATALLLFYVLLVLMGLARVFYSMLRGPGKSRAEGGASYAGDVIVGGNNDAGAGVGEVAAVPVGVAMHTPAPPPVYEARDPSARGGVSNNTATTTNQQQHQSFFGVFSRHRHGKDGGGSGGGGGGVGGNGNDSDSEIEHEHEHEHEHHNEKQGYHYHYQQHHHQHHHYGQTENENEKSSGAGAVGPDRTPRF